MPIFISLKDARPQWSGFGIIGVARDLRELSPTNGSIRFL
jgi:hypothetical protein